MSSKFFGNFDKNISADLSELQFASTEERFDIVFSQSEFFFMIFRLYLQKFFQILAEKFWLVCQKCKMGVQGLNSSEITFWRKRKFFIIFVFWVKTFQTSGKKKLAGF